MKKILTVALVLFLSLSAIAQKNQRTSVLREITEPTAQILSSKQQTRLQTLQQSDNYQNVTLIKIEGLEQALIEGSLSFELLGIYEPAVTKTIDYSSKNNFTWNGSFKKGDAFLIHENGRTYGHIRKDGKVFDIQYLENGYAILIEYNMEKLNQLGCTTEGNHEEVKTSKSNDKIGSSKNGTNAQATVGTSSSPMIQVLILFTPAAEATGMNLTDLANTARAQWLTAQLNSSVHSNLRIVGVEELNFVENGVPGSQTGDPSEDSEVDVNRLRDNIEAQQLRDQFEADIVILFTDGDYEENGRGIGGTVANIGPVDDDAYRFVQVANATSTITWAHEVAHLFGARHQFPADSTPGDAHGHNWSTGWWFWKDEYRSIMRTYHSDMERVLHFSNPNVTHEGKATGVLGASNNARVINVNGHILEDFRFTQPNMSVAIYGPGMRDDGDPLIFTSSVGNGQSPIIYNWQVDIGEGYYTAGASSSFNYTMPTGTDLDVRLTVTGSDGQSATDYHSVMNSFLGGGCTVCPDSIALDFSSSETTLDNHVLELEKSILYPNPSSDKIQLVFKENLSEFDRLQIINLSGEVQNEIGLQPQNKDTGQLTIDISGLRQGTYIIKLLGKGTVSSFRFIKK